MSRVCETCEWEELLRDVRKVCPLEVGCSPDEGSSDCLSGLEFSVCDL